MGHWGINQNDCGTNGSTCGNALVCMLKMSSSEEQVQEGVTSRSVSTVNCDWHSTTSFATMKHYGYAPASHRQTER